MTTTSPIVRTMGMIILLKATIYVKNFGGVKANINQLEGKILPGKN